jgi:hypothetical protein
MDSRSRCALAAWRRVRAARAVGCGRAPGGFLRRQGRRRGLVRTAPTGVRQGRTSRTASGSLRRGQLDGRSVGVIGELHPRWVQKYELGTAPVVFELDLAAILSTPFPEYAEVSRFPAVVRDLALVVQQNQVLAPLLAALRAAAPAIVRDVALFDVYQGKGLDESEKSLAFRIVMQDTQRTLEDAEVEAAVASLLAVATRDFNASLRVKSSRSSYDIDQGRTRRSVVRKSRPQQA